LVDLLDQTMSKFGDSTMTVPEAAYVAAVTETTVNREIDARIVRARGRKGQRAIRGADIVYLGAVRGIREQLSPQLRRRLREAIVAAVEAARPVARVAALEVRLAPIEEEIHANFVTLERMKHDHLESRPEVLGGEPVIKGTRIPARLVAHLVREGTSARTLRNEYDLTREQIEAAVIFDRVTPKRGRPPSRKLRVKTHVPAH
jgi:uncharacterized protein (DUF433 family)